MNNEELVQKYKDSESLLKNMGFDLSRDSILKETKLPPIELWDKDDKLGPFKEIVEDQLLPIDIKDKLINALKGTRSASIASVRGNLFNRAIAEIAKNAGYTIEREVSRPQAVSELVDVVATNPKTGKEIMIMCQICLWGGGEQSNRADKYLDNENIVCVVFNQYKLPKTSKAAQAMQLSSKICKAIENQRLFWAKDFQNFLEERL